MWRKRIPSPIEKYRKGEWPGYRIKKKKKREEKHIVEKILFELIFFPSQCISVEASDSFRFVDFAFLFVSTNVEKLYCRFRMKFKIDFDHSIVVSFSMSFRFVSLEKFYYSNCLMFCAQYYMYGSWWYLLHK